MSELGVHDDNAGELRVTLLVDGSEESQRARLLLEDSGVPFIIVPSGPDPDGSERDLPAVYVPIGSRFNGTTSIFRGLREIRTVFLPRFLSEKAS